MCMHFNLRFSEVSYFYVLGPGVELLWVSGVACGEVEYIAAMQLDSAAYQHSNEILV